MKNLKRLLQFGCQVKYYDVTIMIYHNVPITQHGNKYYKCQLSWIDKWNWIALEDSIYYKYCGLFSVKKRRKVDQLLGQLCN